jgi:hypothetical protein
LRTSAPIFRRPSGKLFDLVERQAVDIYDLGGALDIQLHEIEQGRSTGDKPDLGTLLRGVGLSPGLNGLRYAGSLGVFEYFHDAISYACWRTSWMAATMLE